MMLPNAEQAIVDTVKLRDYCLNPVHPVGKHKARVFAAVLGLTSANADILHNALLQAARSSDAVIGEQDEYGQRYSIDLLMLGVNRYATIRSAWMVRTGEDFARLTTCYVL